MDLQKINLFTILTYEDPYTYNIFQLGILLWKEFTLDMDVLIPPDKTKQNK